MSPHVRLLRGILWLSTPDPVALAQSNAPIWLGLAGDGSSVVSGW
ncbi:hypothetical protein [Pectobacterium brasiliense]|nr:hypothetical protein [Pectobacterium brasiliense]